MPKGKPKATPKVDPKRKMPRAERALVNAKERKARMDARAEKRAVGNAHVPSAETRAAVASMKATFLSHELIALQLAIDKKTLEKHYRVELDTAAERANASVVSNLYSHTKKSPVACFYWLQNRAPDQWQDKRNANAPGAGGLSLSDLVLASMGKHPLVNGTTAAAPANGNANGHDVPKVNGHAKPNGTNGHG